MSHLQTPDLPTLVALIKRLAREELVSRFRHVERSFKADRSIVTAADLAMQAAVGRAVTERWPSIPILGEEMESGEQQRLLQAEGEWLWVLDPVDGTSNFASGIPYFAVSLALLKGGRPYLGIVYDPVADECFAAEQGKGAWLNGELITQVVGEGLPLERTIAIVDLKRLPRPLAARLATDPPYASQRSFGAVALDICWLAVGRVQLYLHGRQMIWDHAAAWLIFAEVGGHATTLEGEVTFLPTMAPRNAVAALDREHFRMWCNYLGVVAETAAPLGDD